MLGIFFSCNGSGLFYPDALVLAGNPYRSGGLMSFLDGQTDAAVLMTFAWRLLVCLAMMILLDDLELAEVLKVLSSSKI
jgi:hypothetical protein